MKKIILPLATLAMVVSLTMIPSTVFAQGIYQFLFGNTFGDSTIAMLAYGVLSSIIFIILFILFVLLYGIFEGAIIIRIIFVILFFWLLQWVHT
jgi:hypothetical protein